jgi:hypothetical protein
MFRSLILYTIDHKLNYFRDQNKQRSGNYNDSVSSLAQYSPWYKAYADCTLPAASALPQKAVGEFKDAVRGGK